MQLDDDGFLRPVWQGEPGTDQVGSRAFKRVCPGIAVNAPEHPGMKHHDTMGDYVSAWSAFAADSELRFEGSSGGVLTALSQWLIDTGRVTHVVGSGASEQSPSRTVALQLRTRDEVLRAAGSRYAPVAAVAMHDPGNSCAAFVGKPCEAYAARRLHEARIRRVSCRSKVL